MRAMDWVRLNGVDRRRDFAVGCILPSSTPCPEDIFCMNKNPAAHNCSFSHFSIVIRGDCRTGPTGCFVEMNVLTREVRGRGNGSDDVSIDSSANQFMGERTSSNASRTLYGYRYT